MSASPVRHLYVHVPFCVHRCGYCDFVTAVGGHDLHARYVEALLGELRRERHLLDDTVDTVFVGGGTPTFTELASLRRLLAELPRARETTVEANPETVTPEVAETLAQAGVTRVSIGAQSFSPALLAVLERTASPDQVRRAAHLLRDVGIDNLSLDLLYGIPGQSAADLASDLEEALALGPDHLSCYELEAKPGTRFAHAWGAELEAQADAMERHLEQVVRTLTAAGLRWYETANFCRAPSPGERRDLRAQHNLAVWRGADYLGLGVGAVSTLGPLRRRNAPSLPAYLAAVESGQAPRREVEHLDTATRARERLMLGLRLDEPVDLDGLGGVVDDGALHRLVEAGLVAVTDGSSLLLTTRGRFLGGAVTSALISWEPHPTGDTPPIRCG